ncbi:MAG: PcfJ domain-containing protein [Treponema sp.]|nr:PcfJ domain-containing protein [Treponema sp.]
MRERKMWYRSASEENPFGIWKNLPLEKYENRVILRHSENGKIFCPYHSAWENYTTDDEFSVTCERGKSFSSLVIPWLPQKEPLEIPETRGVIILTKENLRARGEEQKRLLEENVKLQEFLEDEEGIIYDKFLIELETDFEKCECFLRGRLINRDVFLSSKNRCVKIPERYWAASFFLCGRKTKGGKTIFVSATSFEENPHSPFIVDGVAFPHFLNVEIEETAKRLVASFAGRSIHVDTSFYQNNGYGLLTALSYFPYNVNIYETAIRMDFLDSIKTENPWIDRNDPDIFNRLLKKLGLQTFTEFRRNFPKNPRLIIWYKNLHDMGFRDVNVIADILRELEGNRASGAYKEFEKVRNGWTNQDLREKTVAKLSTTFFECIGDYEVFSEKENPFIFFCGYSIPLRGERATWNSLNKEPGLSKYEMKDIARMFSRYFTDLKSEEREMVLKDGFTRNVHNTLSNIIRSLKHENHVFEYTERQKRLIDEIDGFKFMLPVDSAAMHTLGSAMHNCVFSYWERVRLGDCTIVYAMKNDEYKACIELSRQHILQVRGDYNSALEGETAKAFKKWCKKHNLL